MKTRNWNENELRLLEEWDWVKRYIDTQYPEQVSEIDKLRYLILEARLLITNKLVIFYLDENTVPEGILSFREYLLEIEKAAMDERKISFHPINFKNRNEYQKYIVHIREEFFALLN
jgi:hypothetical protein